MKVGYCVEGSTDDAMLQGLRERWCPDAELVQGHARGAFRRREIPKVCLELQSKGVDVIVLLRDANDEPWRDVARDDRNACAAGHQHLTIFGVCDRNVECWLTADREYAAAQTGAQPAEFDVPDPQPAFDAAMGITALDRKKAEIAAYTRRAPLRRWLDKPSFSDFYEQLRQKAKEQGCEIENLRERRA